MVTKEQINKCLALKKKLAKTKGKKVALGALLLKKGYLDKDQLEEIVALHNEEKEKSGESSAKSSRTKKKRRSKRAKAVEPASEDAGDAAAAADESASEEPRASRRAKRAKSGSNKTSSAKNKTSSAKDKTSSAKNKTSSAKNKTSSAKNKTSARRSSRRKREEGAEVEAPATPKRKKSSSTDKAKTRRSKRAARSESGIDPAVFQSAPDGAIDEEDRRIIACAECGKKYRIRPKQVGKRFPCRRCKNRVRVPKDLFERPVEPAGVEVDEFTLSSADMADSGDSDAGPTTSQRQVAAAAATAVASVQKVRKKPSIADLAAQAEKAQKRGLKPKTTFGVREAATVGVCVVLLGVVGYGFMWWRADLERKAQEQLAAELNDAYEPWESKLNDLLARAGKALESPESGDDPTALYSDLEKVVTEGNGLLHLDNRAKATAAIEAGGVKDTQRRLLTTQGLRLVDQGGFRIEEGIQALTRAVEAFPDDPEARMLLGKVLVRARRCAEAVQALQGVKTEEGKALLGLAYERGADATKAEAAYRSLQDPLGPVLAARAYVSAGEPGRAVTLLENLSLDGVDEAVAKVVEGVAQAAAGQKDKAVRALTAAIKAAPDDPFPRLYRARFLLGHGGRVADALQDIEQANRITRTAWGYQAFGDVLAAQLRLSEARSKYDEAMSLPLHHEAPRLVAGIDPYRFAHEGDPRADAACRLAALALELGDTQAASGYYARGEELDPFHPMPHVGLANILLRQGQADAIAGARLDRAADLCRSLGGGSEESYDLIRSRHAAEALLARASYLVANGHPQPAVEALDAAKNSDPHVEAQVEALKAQIYTEHLTQEKRALSSSRRAARAEVQTDRLSGRLFDVVRKLYDKRKPDDSKSLRRALDGLLVVLSLNPYHANALVLRSKVQAELKQFEQALADLDRAETVNPFLREVFVTRGFLLIQGLPESMRNRETAKRAGRNFDVAIDLESSQRAPQAESFYGRALVHYQGNDHAAAEASLQQCITTDANYALAYKLRAEIRKLRGDDGYQEDLRRYQQLAQQN
jgi:tetratricopeptide (TPR) repeat protein